MKQTMLRLFGIPYITAPMEAEAQCAALGALGLVDGIITDDSDVFLFGGKRVLKNMFNQSKTVECFLLPDLARELGLERDTLIRLAYLLGSDYVEGLPGVGPVVAMELLREFPGEDGLHKFKDWWRKVQMGKDRESETHTKFRKRFVSQCARRGSICAAYRDLCLQFLCECVLTAVLGYYRKRNSRIRCISRTIGLTLQS
jgi:DNA excision repair protein ERCC-5